MSTSVTPNLDSISLYYKEGPSNKEYHLSIIGDETSGFTVQFRYGKKGSTMKVGTKNKAPVDYLVARRIFDDILTEKQGKGYTGEQTGTPYQSTTNADRVSGVLPQLLNFIEESEVNKYINDDNWIMQQKMDGERRLIKKTKKTVEGINRKGLVVSLPTPVEQAVAGACGHADAILDGEMVGEIYWLFDILAMSVHNYSDLGYGARLGEIQEWFGEMSDMEAYFANFRIVPTAIGKTAKKKLYDKLKKENAEGVVFKKIDALYKVGRPASGGNQVKFKFYATATIRVKEASIDKRSVTMEVQSLGGWVNIGKVTITPNYPVPDPGTLAEVRYLYAYHDGSLFQPTYLGPREDADESACVGGQLKFKAPDEE